MKRPSAINTKIHEDSELFNTAPSSSQTFVEEPVSPSNNNISDTDSLSDSSRLRKKRNTYQKISDDIRVNLLESVQKGETLKAAAKRHKINYSSAKSILHTYRKEGRILKKSAQERTMKRKGETSPEHSEEPRPTKQGKKENMQPTSTDAKVTKSVHTISDKKKPLAQSATNTVSENSTYTKDKSNTSSLKTTKTNTQDKVATEENKSQSSLQATQNLEESVNKTLAGRDHIEQSEMNYAGNTDTQKTKRFDSFHTTYKGAQLPENGSEHPMGDGHDHTGHVYGSDPFNDVIHSLHNRGYPHDDGHHNNNAFFFPHGFGNHSALEDKTSKVENGMSFEDFHFGGFADCPLKSFMDTQNLFREALRKASFFSQGGNTTGGRKDSIDFFKI